MQRDMQVEVILCPNCEEEVPKTLYCLNCGYPLYKVEEEQEQVEIEEAKAITIEETPEQIEPEPTIEWETEPEVSPIAEEIVEAPSESTIDEVEIEEEPETVSVEEAEEPEETVELAESVEALEEMEVEALKVQEPEILEEDQGVSEIEVVVVEEEPSEIHEEEPMESIEGAAVEIAEEIVEAKEVEFVEEVEEEPVSEEPSEEVPEATVELKPDPITTMVMENLLKNISLKVRLVNLLTESDVKETTFTRLFESYAARGDRWMNRRNEMLERCRYNLDAMEKRLSESRTGLEELEIRKAIDDATEEEYQAKAPAFEWDIQVLDGELRSRKGEIAYLEDLTTVMTAEEIQKLTEMAENCYEAFDGLEEAEKVSSETAERVKASLREALDCLKGSGC